MIVFIIYINKYKYILCNNIEFNPLFLISYKNFRAKNYFIFFYVNPFLRYFFSLQWLDSNYIFLRKWENCLACGFLSLKNIGF